MDIDEIPEFLCARAGKNDLLVTFHEGLFLYYEHQFWLGLKFRGKNYFVILFFISKLKRLVHWLSYRQCRCLVHSVFLKYVLNCIWSKQAIVLLIINGKIIFLNFSYSSYSCTFFILSYLLFHTLEGTVRKMAIDRWLGSFRNILSSMSGVLGATFWSRLSIFTILTAGFLFVQQERSACWNSGILKTYAIGLTKELE